MFVSCLWGIYFLWLWEKYSFLFISTINKIEESWDFYLFEMQSIHYFIHDCELVYKSPPEIAEEFPVPTILVKFKY